jgi:hypothetical protein
MAARDKGLEVTGTLGILDLAARRGMIDFANALARLRTTNFRGREELSMHCSGNISAAASRERRYHCQPRTSELEMIFLGAQTLAPRHRHVSNFCGPIRCGIERGQRVMFSF